MARKKKSNPADIDNKYELGAYLLDFISKHWWKAVILIVAAGLMITGFNVKCGKYELHKDQIKAVKEK